MKHILSRSSKLSVAGLLALCAATGLVAAAFAPAISVLPPLHAQVDAPARLACDAQGNTCVVDTAGGRVVFVDAYHRVIKAKTGLRSPLGIALDHSGNMYVGEAGVGCVTVFDSQGNPVSQLGGGDGEFELPNYIALDEGTTPPTVYVSDSAANTLKAYQGGALVRTMGGLDSATCRFDFPAGVWVNAAGEVFCADQNNARVLVFSRTGIWLRSFNLGPWNDPGTIGRPAGVSGDNTGRIFLADTFQDFVKAFDEQGTLLATFSGYGAGAGQLRSPAGIALDPHGRLKVASPNNGRVEVFGLDCFTQFAASPASQAAAAGSTVTFSTQPGCHGRFTFQWRKGADNLIDGGTISGATNATLTLAGISTSDAGNYSVVITGPDGTVTSPELQLVVITPPALLSSPASTYAALGAGTALSAAATGDGLAWRWFFNGVELPGANTNTLALTNVQFSATGQYWAVATNLAGTVTSAPATLTVLARPYIITGPASQTVAERATATFSVQAGGGSPLGYQWFFGATPLAGQTSSSLVLPNVTPIQAGTYRVQVSNPVGTTNSLNATLVVQPDTAAPIAQKAQGGAPNARTILVVFSEAVSPTTAQQTANYQLLAPDGLTVIGAVVSNTSTVVLTLSGNRNPDLSYQLRVQDVQDTAYTPNLMTPNPTVLPVLVDDPFATVGWWPLDEGAGIITADASGNGRNGTLQGAIWTTGYSGAGLSFNGASSAVSIPALNLNTNTVTITAWVRRNGAQVGFSGIVFYRSGNTVAGLNFGTANELRYHWNDTSSSYNYNSGLVVPDGVWTFTAVVVEPTRATFYLNNGSGMSTAVNTTTHAIEEFNGSGYLGYEPSSTTRRFNGALDEVRIFNHALSAAQVQALYTARATPAIIAIASPANGAVLATQSPTLLANVVSRGNTIDKVEFLSGATVLGSTRTPPYSMVWSNLPTGNYSAQARVWFGSAKYSATSPVANFAVSSPIVSTLTMMDGTMLLEWAGGFPPYQVQVTTNLSEPAWENVGATTNGTNRVIEPGSEAAFYRIIGN
jgi:hypothetical protein